MADRHNGRGEEARQEHRRKQHLDREDHGPDGVVSRQAEELTVELAVHCDLHGVDTPDCEQHRVRERPVPVLDLAQPVVVLGRRLPEEEGRVDHEILVDAHHVGQRVVQVVLVAPPRRAHAAAKLAESAHERAPLAASVSVVVGDPARARVGNRQHDRRQHEIARLGREDGGGHGATPAEQMARLAHRVPFEPALLLELGA
mmetsp:Transcript_44959/g.123270  ORF Transcript_44959/g.123270 Transcript_44959/m.123270 type:complete len:201 (-) Transcript_44959:580-1182(-)